ncbi:MAG: primosomal protein N' [Planctomycetes bacterium]|nr:primosomal protein N' [Planctomycetota bacterium]
MHGRQQNLFEAHAEPEKSELLLLASVALELPLAEPYSYTVPDALLARVVPGVRVRVSVGTRTVSGFVTALEQRPAAGKLKPILEVLDEHPALTPATLQLGLWVAKHYAAHPGEALAALVPAAVRHRRHGREILMAKVLDAAAAKAWIVNAGSTAALAARVRMLRLLLEQGTPMPLQELASRTHSGTGPAQTLARLGLVSLQRTIVAQDPFALLNPKPTTPPQLNADQANVLQELLPALDTRKHSAFLLHGVTGSGKTEVYLRLLERVLQQGRDAILLVPEISLTPQTVERLLSRLPTVAVLHSHLSDGERTEQWERLRSGAARIAVGPRSAIFAPLPNLGLIILDEEHETSFKQQQAPRYHARDVALARGRIENCLVLCGSATPSLESEALVHNSEMTRLSLPRRVMGRPLPQVGLVDMRSERAVGPGGIFSRKLVVAIEETLRNKEQVLLFLNRRGFSTTVVCRMCAWKAMCKDCAIHLTHYKGAARLLCHYCGSESPAPTECPDCRQSTLRFSGFGTEKVAAAAEVLFPKARIVRRDGDALRSRGAPEKLFADLKSGNIDILIGTQVLAKGFDIPGITLVGVISADTALLVPDFRSAERTFQLLCQVAGRAGRGDQPGRVIVQTSMPEHFAITCAAQHDHATFIKRELAARAEHGYPPSGRLLRLVVQAIDPQVAAQAASALGESLRTLPAVVAEAVFVDGPAPCPLPILQGEHRHHLLVRAPTDTLLSELLPLIPRKAVRGARIIFDRDPVAML